jgi:hypothetical protein
MSAVLDETARQSERIPQVDACGADELDMIGRKTPGDDMLAKDRQSSAVRGPHAVGAA